MCVRHATRTRSPFLLRPRAATEPLQSAPIMSGQQPGASGSEPSVEAARGQWAAWATSQPGIPKRQRAKAVEAALNALQTGATPEQAANAGWAAAKEGYAAYYARASVIVGAISLVISIATGGISILFGGATIFAGYQGLKSTARHTEAIIGLSLGGLSVLLFVGHLLGLVPSIRR